MNERIDQLRTQLREDPSSRLFFQLGELLRKEDQLEEAVEVLRKGLEVYPRYVAAWVSLGRALYDLSSFADAETAFANALNLDPENPIAARMMGETAMGRQDWVQAIKSLKLARVFSPRDDDLEEKITFVEERLAELGQLEGGKTTGEAKATSHREPPSKPGTIETAAAPEEALPAPPAEPAVGPVRPFTDSEAGVVTEQLPPMWSLDEPAFAVSAAPPVEVFNVSLEDPFTDSRPSGDTGVFVFGDDVFGSGSEMPSVEVEPAAPPDEGGESTEPVAFLPPLSDDEELSATVEPGGDTVPGVDLSAEVAEAEALFEAPTEADQSMETEGVESFAFDAEAARGDDRLPAGNADERLDDLESPIPTLTLARLALEQGDHDLAESTLVSLLEMDPEHTEATEMLAALHGEPAHSLPAVAGRNGLVAAKTSALTLWLARVQQAAAGSRA